jgi:hypothetical protein
MEELLEDVGLGISKLANHVDDEETRSEGYAAIYQYVSYVWPIVH